MLGAAEGPGRWFVGVAVLPVSDYFIEEEEAALGNHSVQSPASVWVASPGHAMGHWKVKCSLCSVQQVWWPALGAAAGVLCRWFVGGAVLPVCGDFQRRRQHSATTAHRALPV